MARRIITYSNVSSEANLILATEYQHQGIFGPITNAPRRALVFFISNKFGCIGYATRNGAHTLPCMPIPFCTLHNKRHALNLSRPPSHHAVVYHPIFPMTPIDLYMKYLWTGTKNMLNETKQSSASKLMEHDHHRRHPSLQVCNVQLLGPDHYPKPRS